MWELSREQIGALDCRVVKPSPERGEPRAVAVFCHGFGAPGDDLVPVAEELLSDSSLAGKPLAFVFPSAPLALDPSGESRAWWPIDMARLQALSMTGDISGMSDLVPGRLGFCRGLIGELLEQLRSRWSLPARRMVIGGFSQGAMLATDVALHAEDRCGGLVAWSGALINQTEWRQLATSRTKFPIVQSHGLWDPILPFAAGQALHDLLTDSGYEVDFVRFQGYHSIHPAALGATGQLLRRLVE